MSEKQMDEHEQSVQADMMYLDQFIREPKGLPTGFNPHTKEGYDAALQRIGIPEDATETIAHENFMSIRTKPTNIPNVVHEIAEVPTLNMETFGIEWRPRYVKFRIRSSR